MAEPWAHGTVVRATEFTRWWDVNALRLEGPAPAGLTATAVAEEADRRLAGLEHRKVELEDEATGAALAAGLASLGWRVDRLAWMWRDGTLPLATGAAGLDDVVKLPHEDVVALQVAWLLEERVMPDEASIRAFLAEQATAEARLPGELRCLGRPGTAFVSVRLAGADGEIEDAYVGAGARGAGLGTRLLRAAMARARATGVRDLWILADADGRPRELYERLGFRAAWTHYGCVRPPR